MRCASRGIRLFTVAIAGMLPGMAGAQTESVPSFVDAWVGGPLDSLYNAEYRRVQEACQGRDDTCYAVELDTTAVRLAPVYATPQATEPTGWLAARLRPRGRWPYAGLIFVGADGREVPLLDDLGDWGYGTTLDVVESREGTVRPWLLTPAGVYWLSTESGRGFGVVEGPYGLDGRLWRLGPLDLPTSGGTTLAEGVYMVLAVENGTVSMRAELPEDTDCMGTAKPTADGPPPEVHRVPLGALLDSQGRPAVAPAYPKGC